MTDPNFFEGVVANLGDGFAILGADGSVTFANQSLATLLRMPLDDLVGSNGLQLIHPDELSRALDAIVFATQFPDRTAVVPFQLRRGDGTFVDVELKSGTVPGPDGDLLALVVRDGTTRTTVSAAIATIANDEPLASTATLLARAVASRWPNTAAMVELGSGAAAHRVVEGVPAELQPHHDPGDRRASGRPGDTTRSPDGPRPWDLARAQGHTVVVDLADMPPALAEDARRHGFAACGVAPVDVPASDEACIIAWFDEPAAAHLEFPHAVIELAEILRLASERRYHLEQLSHAARHDPLTGLLNRGGFFTALDERLAAEDRGGMLVLLYIDLDGFKPINDRHGHAIGDRVLVEVAWRIAQAVGADDIVGRLGGDEFALVALVPAAGAGAAADAIARRILAALTQPMMVGHGDGSLVGPVKVSASVGVALMDAEDDAELIVDRADAAMYQAKAEGGARTRLWQTT